MAKLNLMKQLVTAILLLIIAVGCGPSDNDKANRYKRIAEEYLKRQDTLTALTYLDSIKRLPEATAYVKYTKDREQVVFTDWKFRVNQQKDSLNLQIKQLEKSFVKSKGDFDRYYQYTHKRQTVDRAWDRSFIQVHLDQRGEIHLSSNYYGEKWLNHTGLRVYDGKDQAKTLKVSLTSADNYHSEFDKGKWEKVTFRGKADNGVIQFIANNYKRRLKAVFLGKRYYYIILETYDKIAVRDALALSKALKKRAELQKRIKWLNKKLAI